VTSYLLATHIVGRFFKPADAQTIFQKIGSSGIQEGTDFAEIADQLDFIAQSYVSAYRRTMTATAGELQEWFRDLEHLAKDLLATCGVQGTLDPLTSNAVNLLLYTVPTDVGIGFNLRSALRAETHSPEVPSEWQTIRVALRSLQFLAHRARIAIVELEDKKGAHRKARTEEIYLVSALDHLYFEVTGERRSYTIDTVNGTQGGPLVELVALVAAHMCANLQAVTRDAERDVGLVDKLAILSRAVTPDGERDVGLVDKLTNLSRSPRRIIWRIRQVRNLAATLRKS
jgi:hypothetical protein